MKEKKSEAPRRGNEELFKWYGNPTFGQMLRLLPSMYLQQL